MIGSVVAGERGQPGVKRVAVLASGRGSNLQALLDAVTPGTLSAQIAVVISDRAAAPALARAAQAGVPAVFCDPRGRRPRGSRASAHPRGLRAAPGRGPSLSPATCACSPASVVARFPRRILNVHPSLLPAFPGLDAQRQALDHGVKITGATVHLVDPGLDSGPIVLQEAVQVRDDDTVESLSGRILQAEHRIFPRALELLLLRPASCPGRRVEIRPRPQKKSHLTLDKPGPSAYIPYSPDEISRAVAAYRRPQNPLKTLRRAR